MPRQVAPSLRKDVDHRAHPELYRVGRGEQGVLTVEPYKSELLPLWRFKTPEIAQESARKIYAMFTRYRKEKDFVGMDMARKYLQMGWTRARRYANHQSGKKWSDDGKTVLPPSTDPVKEQAARIFQEHYRRAKADPYYIVLKAKHQRTYG